MKQLVADLSVANVLLKKKATLSGLVLKPNTTGRPTKPSLPINPTSTDSPSGKTVSTEPNPLFRK